MILKDSLRTTNLIHHNTLSSFKPPCFCVTKTALSCIHALHMFFSQLYLPCCVYMGVYLLLLEVYNQESELFVVPTGSFSTQEPRIPTRYQNFLLVLHLEKPTITTRQTQLRFVTVICRARLAQNSSACSTLVMDPARQGTISKSSFS